MKDKKNLSFVHHSSLIIHHSCLLAVHSSTRPLESAAASRLPSEQKATQRPAQASCNSSRPVSTSHRRAVASLPPPAVASRSPLGLKDNPVTGPAWPSRVNSSLPDSASHSRAVSSSPPVASSLPSARKASVLNSPSCPSSESNSF